MPGTPNEGPLQFADAIAHGKVFGTADESIGPSVRQKRGPQDDKLLVNARFGTLFTTILQIRLSFASIYVYNPARLVSTLVRRS